jgi:sugar lactone lactonase YvrE
MNTNRVSLPLISRWPGAIAALALLLPSAWAQTGPSITTQPASQTNLAGASASLSVAVSGTGPFNYQWRFNGTNLPNLITTVAGGGTNYPADGGAATKASLYGPSGVAVDASGNLFIVGAGTNRVGKVGTNGVITIVAGKGNLGYSGDGGAATNASLSQPLGVAVDTSGNLFIADTYNNLIRKVDVDGVITTVAGNGYGAGTFGGGYSGDGGAATNAGLNLPACVAVNASGNLFIADTSNSRIRKVGADGVITTVAGNGSHGYAGDGGAATSASLNYPAGVAVDASGNLFILEVNDSRIRKVGTNGIITTVAGNGSFGYSGDGGAATSASLHLNYPDNVAVDGSGNLFIADTSNGRIRKVDVNGIITTVAGNGSSGYSGDGGSAASASLRGPSGVAVDASGNLLIADTGNGRIRKVALAGLPTLTLANVSTSAAGDYQVIIVGPYGSVTSSVASLTVLFPPSIISQPANVAVAVGGAAKFTVAATGTPPLSYAWYFNGFNPVQAGTNSALSLANVSLTMGGYYTVVITNLFGSVTGDVATLSVGYPPTIASEPTNKTALFGSTATLTVAAAGVGPFTYQWQFNGTNGPYSFPSIPSLTLANVSGSAAGDYQVVITSPYGSVTSSVATLTVLAPPSIVAQPANFAVAVGGAATFSVAATGDQPLSYAWYCNGTNLVQTGTNTTLSLAKVTFAAGGSYTVVITNLFGTVTSDVATLSVGHPPSIANTPTNQTALFGSNVALKVSAGGDGPFTYQWQLNGIKLPNDIISTVAGGGDGGAATNASLKNPVGVALDASGNLFIADNGVIRKVDAKGVITSVAGNGSFRYSGDGGAAINASLGYLTGVAVDVFGNLFIADQNNNRIRKVDVNDIITTVAGGGNNGPGDGGAATNASLSPSGVAVDASGNLFIADQNNGLIRKVDLNGIITTVAGGGGYNPGDGGAATNASLSPFGVVVDTSGNLFIADQNSSRIRKVNVNGIITTVAGNGSFGYSGDGGAATSASLDGPSGVAVDASGNLFINDLFNNRIRKVNTNGIITTVAGNGFVTNDMSGNIAGGYSGDGGAATNASLNNPAGLVVDASGNLFMADSGNSRIRKLDLHGIITTVAGGGVGDGGAATHASLNNPSGVAVDASGNLFIDDQNNGLIRKVDLNGIITTVAGGGTNYPGDGGAATNASLSPSGVAVDASGNLFIDDQNDGLIRKVDLNGIITTVAGGGTNSPGNGGTATNASLSPSRVAVDASGNLFIADQNNGLIRKVDLNGIITTVAGGGTNYHGDGGAATNTSLAPSGMAVDTSGNLFIADNNYGSIRKVDVNGIITTVAGGGNNYLGDGGAATNASLYASGVAVDASGNLFIVDRGNSRIRKVDFNGIITTVAGNGPAGYWGMSYSYGSFSGDGGAATNASLNFPSGVAVDASGNLFIADSANNRIREVALSDFPKLPLENVSAENAGNYQVIIISPYGSVTGAVATVTVLLPPSSQIPGMVMGVPRLSGDNLVLGFSLSQTSSASITVLQAPSITGPWRTNTAAVLSRNAQTGGYQFSVPRPNAVEFYQLRSP